LHTKYKILSNMQELCFQRTFLQWTTNIKVLTLEVNLFP